MIVRIAYIQNRVWVALLVIIRHGKRGANAFAVPWAIRPDNKRLPDALITHEKKYEYPIVISINPKKFI